jgi:protein-S-isoprenylcysteine O-methyltransferase Ste14
MSVISRLAGVVMIAAVVVLIVTGSFLSTSPVVIACQVGAVALTFWARGSFARGQFRASPVPGGEAVIRRGPYRFIRHPMYASALLLVWATVLGHWTTVGLVTGIVVVLVVIVRIGDEERRLRERYPDYQAYARSTRRLVPFVL